MNLSKQELLEIKGGAVKAAVWLAIGSAIALIVGVVDGYLRPLKCRK